MAGGRRGLGSGASVLGNSTAADPAGEGDCNSARGTARAAHARVLWTLPCGGGLGSCARAQGWRCAGTLLSSMPEAGHLGLVS